jgi:DNA repair exonuclease SbcCD nuclease subunit
MMKFIHASDIHLDSAQTGVSAKAGAPKEQLKNSTRRALANMVDLALAEEADFVLIAGDLYDGNWRDYNTGLYFAAQMSRLARIPVFLVYGNHDAQNVMTRRLQLPPNVVAFPSAKPKTECVRELGLAVHGQSFADRAVVANLAAAYPPPVDGLFNIGLLHTAADGREGHQPYAPCSLAELVAKNYDYWALGHVHDREVLWEHPHVVFPGNLQGRHPRETGAKGCTLVRVEDGRIVAAEHRPVDVLRWAALEIDVAGAADVAAAVERVREALVGACDAADGRHLAVRLTLTGACEAHGAMLADPDLLAAECRAAALAVSDVAWIEKAVLKTRPTGTLPAGIEERPDAIGALVRSLNGVFEDPETIRTLTDELQEIVARLPDEAKVGDDLAALVDPKRLGELVDEARALLAMRLADGARGP